jgi:hypothetical protein
MQLGLFASFLSLGVAPLHAQDAPQSTSAPRAIHLPPPPDEDDAPIKPISPKTSAAKPVTKPEPVSKAAAVVKTNAVKQPPVNASTKTPIDKEAAANPSIRTPDPAKAAAAPVTSPAKTTTVTKTSAPIAAPAAKTVIAPTATPQQPTVASTLKPDPVSEEAPVATAGPPPDPSVTFGFYSGETRSEIITAVGKDNILKQSGDILEVAASPKPDPNFETFLLILSPKQGLVKLIATGKDIDGDSAGRVMKTQFATMKTDLGKGYGDPSDNFDFLDVKATHRSANQFMLSLTNNERSLATYWTKKDFGNQITSVSLEGNGLGSDKGYLSLEYEFAGYHNYLLSKK